MAKRVFLLVILIIPCTSLGTTDSAARRQNNNTETAAITGLVVNEKNEPIDGIEVKAFRGAERVAKDRTKGGGRYTLQFQPGNLVSVVTYADYGFCPGSIYNVSGRTTHNITKVLYERNSNVPCPNAEEVKATLDHIRAHPQFFREETQAYADLLNEKRPPGARPLLWSNPGDVTSRNLLLGPGGERMKPDLSKVTFLEEKAGGFSKEYRVRDGSGREWFVKLGKEAQSEAAAVRLLWAVGYKVEITYLVPRVRIQGKGTFENALFEARPENVKRLEPWQWKQNPFLGTRELNGLKVMMVLLNNWDIRDSNNIVLQRKDTGELQYVVSDLGATLGSEGRFFARSRNNPMDYTEHKFIDKIKSDGRVDFNFLSRNRDIFDDITVNDARWVGSLLARLSNEQIADAFRAANYTAEEVEILTRGVRKRIEELVHLP